MSTIFLIIWTEIVGGPYHKPILQFRVYQCNKKCANYNHSCEIAIVIPILLLSLHISDSDAVFFGR